MMAIEEGPPLRELVATLPEREQAHKRRQSSEGDIVIVVGGAGTLVG